MPYKITTSDGGGLGRVAPVCKEVSTEFRGPGSQLHWNLSISHLTLAKEPL